MLATKYIIFIWIVCLVIFTFYCIFRLWYISPPASFVDISEPSKYNAISYIDELLKKDKIQNIPDCANVFDDNVEVGILGYRSCNDAYKDYLLKDLKMNEKYGHSKTLYEICPESTRSPKYLQCLSNLLNKFNTSAGMVEGVNNDMSQSINERLQERSDILNNIQLDMAPYISSSEVKDFKLKTGAGLLSSSKMQPDELLRGISMYYKSKYGVSQSVFANVSDVADNSYSKEMKPQLVKEGFQSGEITIDQYYANTFLGDYKPVKGQYLAFDNILISLDFELPQSDKVVKNAVGAKELDKSVKMKRVISNKGKLILNITDSNTNTLITYGIDKLEKYKEKQNAIALTISSQIINTNIVANTQSLQQLLYLLGLHVPTKIIMTIEIQKNDLGLEYRTYKILNEALDTIMVLQRVS